MRTTIHLCLTALLAMNVLAQASADPVTVTLEDAREALGEPPNFAQTQYAPAALHLRVDGPALRISHARHEPHELRSARTMAEALEAAYGYGLGLITDLDGVDVPAYDGLVFNSDDDVVANFSLRSVRGLVKLRESVARAIRRVDTFSLFQNWPQFVLTSLNESIQHQRVPVEEVTLHTAYYQKRYLKMIEVTRRMTETFGVASGRPTWILVDARDETPLPEGAFEDIREMVSTGGLTTRVYVHQRDRLTVIRQRGVQVVLPCEGDLIAAE